MKKHNNFKRLLTYYLYISISIHTFIFQKENNFSIENIINFFDNSDNYNQMLPYLGTYIPQGLCVVENDIYITAYDGKKKDNSIIFQLLSDGNYRTICLDTKAHVGGITYDDKNQLFWICDTNGTISSYKYQDVIEYDNIMAQTKKLNVQNNDLINHKGIISAAYLTIFENNLYVGNYSKDNNGILKCYQIDDDGKINIENYKIYQIPNYVQGVTFYDYDGTTYILFSESYGKINNSTLEICTFDKNNNDYRNNNSIKYKTPRMMEEICLDKNDNLIMLFESSAYKYKNGINDMERLQSVNIKSLIKKK